MLTAYGYGHWASAKDGCGLVLRAGGPCPTCEGAPRVVRRAAGNKQFLLTLAWEILRRFSGRPPLPEGALAGNAQRGG